MDQRNFELAHDLVKLLCINDIGGIASSINRLGALHQVGTTDSRVDRVRQIMTGRLLGTTTPSTTT